MAVGLFDEVLYKSLVVLKYQNTGAGIKEILGERKLCTKLLINTFAGLEEGRMRPRPARTF